jgi:hypothetical protein
MLVKKIVAASLMTAAISATAADDVAAQLEELKTAYIKQQQEMQAIRQQIKDVESVHSEAIHKYIKDEIKAEVSKQSSLLSLSSHVEGLKIKGDLRLRYQSEDNKKGKGGGNRDRFRQRVRIGAEWKTSEGWDIGIGIATGDTGGSSTNDTYGDDGTWDSGELSLDYAYAKHSWDLGDGKQTLILGKMKTPFFTSKAFFDGDYRPTGAAYQVDMGTVFATAGAFTVQQNNSGRNENDTMLYAAQVGMKTDLFKAAVAYYHYNNTDYDNGNPGDYIQVEDHEVQLIDVVADVYLNVGEVKVVPYGQYSFNNKADDEETAYMIGSRVVLGNFSLSYDWRHMEENAVPTRVMDSDFIGGAGYEGHVVAAKYKLTKNLTLQGKYYMTETIDKQDEDNKRDLAQLDLVYKF